MPKKTYSALNFCLLLAAATGAPLGCNDSTNTKIADDSDTSQALSVGNTTTPALYLQSAVDKTRCLAAPNTSNGTRPTLAACTDAQALGVTQTSKGQLKLGDKCLDVVDGKNTDGASVQLWDCFDDNTNQRWTWREGQMVWTGHTLCLDLKDGVSGYGASLQLWSCSPANRNQQWALQKVESGTPATPAPEIRAPGDRASCKRGISADAGPALSLKAADLAILSPQVTWWYNWYLQPGDASVVAANSRYGLDYVQMVSVRNTDFVALAKNKPAQARYLLTFNEPNFYSQANITPGEAASLWPKIEAYADQHNLLIVSPALNYCGDGCNEQDPIAWMDKFLAACSGCRVDHIAVHAYTCDVPSLKAMSIDPFVKKYGKPIWLTEFDCADSGAIRNDVASQKAFMAEAVAYLEASPHVFRYAWFMAKASGDWRNISLIDGTGKLTELGRYYLSLPQSCKP